ncbi:MAG: DMT family transporter [Euryarchaeota archaeon]|jgi:drug/metabolite transporter (DMT)-like permease|nr:DMT family transporter [Euryarchaeota archaeon]MBT5184467.1 DMT family transporter [Euryarchaeota archaeon]
MVTRRQAATGLFFVTLLWGGTFVWMKQAMNSLEPELEEYSTAGVVGIIVASRFLIAFVALLPFSSRARGALSSKEDWKGGLVLGGLMLVGFVLQMIGIGTVTPSVSAFLTSLYVVFTAILSVKISDRKPTRMMIGGVLLATLGAGFIDGPPHIIWGAGELLTVICALFFALHIIYTDSITKKLDPLAVTSTSFAVLVVGALIFGFASSGGFSVAKIVWSDGVLVPLLCLGLFGSLACILMLNAFQKYLNPTHAAIIYSFEPVWATLYGWYEGMISVSIWLTMGLLLLAGNIVVELGESAKDEPRLIEEPDSKQI